MEKNIVKFEPPLIKCSQGEDIPVFLISLHSATARRQKLIDRGLPLDWVTKYFPAIDMREATPHQISALADLSGMALAMGREIKGGEVGCALSHRNVAAWLAKSKYSIALVLEDDLLLECENWEKKILATAKSLSAHAKRGAAFICLLGLSSSVAGRVLKRKIAWINGNPPDDVANVYLHSDKGGLWRAHAYLISVEAARRSSAAEKNNILTVADHWFERKSRGWIDEIMFTRPVIIAQDEETPSGIGFRRSISKKDAEASIIKKIKPKHIRLLKKNLIEKFSQYKVSIK